jgi:hypothetical protein
MKRSVTIIAGLAVMALSVAGGLLASAPQASAATVSAKVAAGLQQMREEEKLARDVYLELDEQYGAQLPTFANIARSEERHMLAVKRLLTLYRVADPVKSDVPGVFKDPELQRLYNELIAQGGASLKDALAVGVAIEKLDITDLKALRAETSRATIKRVYTSLLGGSYNHLAAFNTALVAYGS